MPSPKDLARWRRNFPAFAEDVLKIQTKDGSLRPFKLNRFQRKLDDIVEEELVHPRGARIILLKARQLGSSTYIAARQYHRTTLWKNRTALTVAHDIDTAEALHRKSLLFWNMSPPEVRPARKLSNRRELQFSKDDEGSDVGLQSRIQIATAKDTHAGIGLTNHALHLSEAARYESVTSDVKAMFTGMMQTVPKMPGTMAILETTAYGLGWFYQLWNDEFSGWRKVFVSWLCDETYIAAEPLKLESLESAEQTRYGNEEALLAIVEHEIGQWYPEIAEDDVREYALRRMRWRRDQIDLELGGDKNLFRQEYPSTAEEAFLTSGSNVFDTRKLADYKKSIIFSERGNYIPERFDAQARTFYDAPYGELRTYENPIPGQRYVIGADVAEGLVTGDNSAAVVLRAPDLSQVAVYQAQVDPAIFADVIATLGRRYNTAYVGVEVNGPGFATNLRLATQLYYPLLYRRRNFDSTAKRWLERTGWHTNRGSKNVMITDLRSAISEDLIEFRDIETLNELGWYTLDPESGKMEAAQGYHDDLVVATAIALQMVYDRGINVNKIERGTTVAPEFSWEWFSQLLSREKDEWR